MSAAPFLRFADWAAWQDQEDQRATAALPVLLDRKRARQRLSPHGFLRGSAPLFYQLLAQRPDLREGPEGSGWVVGDMHLENIGAYRDDRGEIAFDINDCDDATIGPLRFDVLRLLTSALLHARALPVGGAGAAATTTGTPGPTGIGPQALGLAAALLDSYCAARDGGGQGALPAPITRLLEKVRKRPLSALLDARAPEIHGRRLLLRGERYLDLPPAESAAVPELVAAYLRALGPRAPRHAPEWRIDDSAQRVAGTGSLGRTRIAVVVCTRSGEARLLDFKEACPSAVAAVLPAPPRFALEADRVVQAAGALPQAPPELTAAVPHRGRSFVGRKLRPQEDRLDLAALTSLEELRQVLRAIGARLGLAHARGARSLGGPPPPWGPPEQRQLLEQAIELCGLMEGIALAYAAR